MKQIYKIWISLAVMGMLLSSCKNNTGSCKTNNDTVSDIDGNVYHTVTIDTQVWMAENLKTTQYSDGIAIPLLTENTALSNKSTPGYCWSDNDSTNKNTYGALYNWYTIKTDKLCPKGWHVPSDADWTILTDYLGGLRLAGGKLKSKTDWSSPNDIEATNSSCFSALPGGHSESDGSFQEVGRHGYWWSSSEYDINNAWMRRMNNNSSGVFCNNYPKEDGLSVRCIKDK
ncbi:MAG: fibrobacter succinogenes major paralogous domain-containing protein [Bacteroidia bacterium]|nr:fibrobacter succinogenes major paralogous domain-containing protein [Bacteroidia bacterium]